MGRKLGIAVMGTALLIGAIPGSTTPSYATNEPAPLTVLLEGGCKEGKVSPASTHFICVADNDNVAGLELYSVPIDGSAPAIRLSPALYPTTDHVSWFDVTADGTTVVFAQGTSAPSDVEFHRKLYSVPIGGGEPTSLSPSVLDEDLVWQPELSSDGSRVVYWWYNETEGGLHSIVTNGEGFVTIADPVEPNLIPMSTMISPDSSRVLYYTGYGSTLAANSVPLAGGDSVKLSGPNSAGGTIVNGVVTPDSVHYIYRADHDTLGVAELYAVPLAGGVAWKLNHPLETGEWVGELLEVMPDSSGVLYSTLGVVNPPTWYRVPITGGTPIEISQALGGVHISQDSSTVVLDNAFTTAYPLDGGQGVQLAARGALLLSPDSSVAWIWQDEDWDDVAQLYTVPLGGGDLQLHPGAEAPSPEANGELPSEVRMHVTPDSSRFVYAADTNGNGEQELMMVSVHGGDAVELAGDVFTWATDESELSGLYISPDSSRVVYWGDPFGTGAGLYSSQLTRYPEVLDVEWSVTEDKDIGSLVGTIAASDPDWDPLTFEIVGGSDYFDIGFASGEVTLAATLDYEASTQHQLEIAVDDGIVTSTALVTINITDVEDSPPTTSTTTPTTTTTTTLPQPPAFGDVPDTDLFHQHILWLAVEGITKGCNPPINDQFCPDQYVTRGQMAAFLGRALADSLPTRFAVTFNDDDGSIFEPDIEGLAATGVTKGCNPPMNTAFCPNDYVTRGQMAAFLDRALGLPESAEGDLFTDDNGSVFEAQINRLAAAGITHGCNPPQNTFFCPDGNVTRAQMAAFLHRALGNS